MSKLSPKELDKLFQQGSDRHDFEYNPEAWSQMDKLLDKDDRRRRFFWWSFVGLGLMILIFSIYFFARNSSQQVELISNPVNKENNQLPSSTTPETKTIETHNIFSKKEIDTNSTINKEEKKSTTIEQKNNSNDVKNLDYTTPNKKPNILQHKNNNNNTNSISPNKIQKKEKKEKLQQVLLVDSLVNQKNISKENIVLENNAKQDNSNSPTILLQKIDLLSISSFDEYSQKSLVKKLPITLLGYQSSPLNKVNKIKTDALFIGLAFATETSSTDMNDFSKLNLKLGGQMEYRFARKFAASISANFISKKYGAAGSDYQAPKGFWTRKVVPKTVNATCNILEVPLSFSYFFKGFSNNGLYTSIGINSYMMLTEKYQFAYDITDPDLIRKWGTEKENKHWFGIGQISVGYQQYINPKMSIQFAPYLHIPLTGIGHGQIKLWSMGLKLKANFQVK